ncbi:MAG: hypothetical protein IJW86_02405 [Clostridia bacterium]|nr:hypothetical protein [Clostridia bacterium]
MDKKQSSFIKDNPYRFDKTSDFLYDRYNSIRSRKLRIETEQRMRKENGSK